MKKLFFLFSLVVLAPLVAIEVPFEFRFGYYRPSDDVIRDVYGEGLDSQVSVSVRAWKGLYAMTAGNYFRKSGHSLGGNEATTIEIWSASAGLKYLFALPLDYSFYLGAGPRYYFAYSSNDSEFVDRNVDGNDIGFFAMTGFLYHFNCHVFLDAYFEYSWGRVSFSSSTPDVIPRKNVQVGGISAGGGLGFAF